MSVLRAVRKRKKARKQAAAAEIPGAIGLSGSTVSRGFIQASAAQLRELQERDLSREDVVAVVLDGKTFADATMVIALGITLSGLRGDGHGERAGADAVLAVLGRTGPRRLCRAGPLVQDDQLSRVRRCAGRGTLCQSRPLEKLEPAPAVAGNGARRHRTAPPQGGGLPPPAAASRRIAAGTEDRKEDAEHEGRVMIRGRGEFQLRMGLTRPDRPMRTRSARSWRRHDRHTGIQSHRSGELPNVQVRLPISDIPVHARPDPKTLFVQDP